MASNLGSSGESFSATWTSGDDDEPIAIWNEMKHHDHIFPVHVYAGVRHTPTPLPAWMSIEFELLEQRLSPSALDDQGWAIVFRFAIIHSTLLKQEPADKRNPEADATNGGYRPSLEPDSLRRGFSKLLRKMLPGKWDEFFKSQHHLSLIDDSRELPPGSTLYKFLLEGPSIGRDTDHHHPFWMQYIKDVREILLDPSIREFLAQDVSVFLGKQRPRRDEHPSAKPEAPSSKTPWRKTAPLKGKVKPETRQVEDESGSGDCAQIQDDEVYTKRPRREGRAVIYDPSRAELIVLRPGRDEEAQNSQDPGPGESIFRRAQLLLYDTSFVPLWIINITAALSYVLMMNDPDPPGRPYTLRTLIAWYLTYGVLLWYGRPETGTLKEYARHLLLLTLLTCSATLLTFHLTRATNLASGFPVGITLAVLLQQVW